MLCGVSLKLINNSFLQNLLKIGVRIIHGRVLYTGKYGIRNTALGCLILMIAQQNIDFFVFAVLQANSPEDVPPVIPTPNCYLISIYRNELFFVAVVQTEGTVYCM